MVAFNKPKTKGSHHPGPWKAASGGISFDVLAELSLDVDCRPLNFDRLNTIWWILFLLRISSNSSVRIPVISNMPFGSIQYSSDEPIFWPVEMNPQALMLSRNQTRSVSLVQMEWVRDVMTKGGELMNVPSINRAIRTFDQVVWSHNVDAAIAMMWASLETFFRPGQRQITKTLCSSIATFLLPPGPNRDQLFHTATKLYEIRGNVVHDLQSPEANHLFDTYDLARRCFVRCFESGLGPDPQDLMHRWKNRL